MSGAASPGDPPAAWHALAPEEALRRLGSSPEGLGEDEAAARLARWGANAIEVAPPVPAWRILLAQVRSLIAALLVVAAVIAVALGDVIEAASILLVLAVNVALGFATELGARRAMEGLRRLQPSAATVRRGGRRRSLPAAGVVPGDVLILDAGDAVPADARLLTAVDLRAVEAPLTGEPFPVDKSPPPVAADAVLAERTSMVYKGTLVAAGRATALATATGAATEVGRISRLVQETEAEKTPLERRLDALARRLVWLTLGVAAVVTAVGLLRGRDLWLMVETGLALAIAAVPEGLPVVATITLAVGMRRMARRRALVRRLPAVETLGSTTLVCTDKTGTLTAGEMTVVEVRLAAAAVAVSGAGFAPDGELLVGDAPVAAAEVPGLLPLIVTGLLANRAALAGERSPEGDPTEAALLVLARKAGVSREETAAEQPEVGEVPFSSERMLMATFHRDGEATVAHVKGAPGRVLERSARVIAGDGEAPLDEATRRCFGDANQAMAGRGLRVLALARRRLGAAEAPGEAALDGLVFLGLVGISDPPAAGVAETVRLLRGAGVRTVMLTGDQRATAEAVARDLGVLQGDERVIEGRELIGLAGDRLAERVAGVGAFCRVSPADKLHVVEAFQGRGEIVAMLGDGVNDAPALKRADIGVAMGVRGTDVAKEAAAVVLADDRFPTVAAAVEEGRVIFDNIRKFIFYLFSCNLSEVLVLLLGTASGLPLPLLPIQILWLNLVTDVFPALALGMEPGEPDVMRRPPRDPQAEILSRRFLVQVALYGVLITAATLGAFLWALEARGLAVEDARTVAFMTLALAQLFHVFDARSPRAILFGRRLLRNGWVWAALALTLALQAAVVYLPPLARLFHTRPLAAADWGLVLAAALLPLLLGQVLKLRRRPPGR